MLKYAERSYNTAGQPAPYEAARKARIFFNSGVPAIMAKTQQQERRLDQRKGFDFKTSSRSGKGQFLRDTQYVYGSSSQSLNIRSRVLANSSRSCWPSSFF